MNRQATLAFVRSEGDLVEQARLQYLLTGEHHAPTVVQQLFVGQREDGGWSPFWAPHYSSLDATCFRLAQAEQLGMTASETSVSSALTFLAHRQRDDGSWEEAEGMAERTPPWATPGNLAAHLYLTANCGFWLAAFTDPSADVHRAASYLRQHLDEEGQLPTFLHAHWLAGALWYRLRWQEAKQVLSYLKRRLSDMSGSNLAWLMSTLLFAGIPPHSPLIEQAASRLEQYQEEDGRWPSDDGSGRDVHATLEAMRVLRLCGRF